MYTNLKQETSLERHSTILEHGAKITNAMVVHKHWHISSSCRTQHETIKRLRNRKAIILQLLAAGPKYMHMGGLILKMERMADGIVQIPSPHIRPEATAPA